MKVLKRDGRREEVRLSKIQTRLRSLRKIEGIDETPLQVDTDEVAIKVVNGLYDGVTTKELDELAAETAASMTISHPDYDKLAARIQITSLHKETLDSFYDKMAYLYEFGDISEEFFKFCEKHKKFLNKLVDYTRDFKFSYFGFETLHRAYLLKDDNKQVIERPQDMWLRVSAFLHMKDENLDKIKESYEAMSNKQFTHATPTLFNAGTEVPQLSSCFLLDMDSDSIDGIYKTLADCAKISKTAGGIGLSIHKVRSTGSTIRKAGVSDGIVPMLRVYNETMRYVNQEGKRKGSAAIYIEPWHPDVFEFLDLKKNHGKEEMRARDLFYAMWIPDIFMQRVEEDGEWTLFNPKVASELINSSGQEFSDLYRSYESWIKTGRRDNSSGISDEKKWIPGSSKTIRARDLWDKILESQIETGTPYLLYKDASNLKSNQSNLGTIKSSNLCAEIIEYTDEKESAVCNLGSISLSHFVGGGEFKYDELYRATRLLANNLDCVIDINFYPTRETRRSNERHRPIGIGVQGLADVFAKLKLPFASEKSKTINKRIFETIYKAAIDESIALARERGSYRSFKGSPASKQMLQFDLWGIHRDHLFLDWTETFENLSKFGLRNSLSVALMPTASTAQILGNNEAFEPFSSNLYVRRTLSGDFYVVNKYLVADLMELDLWDKRMSNTITKEKGSIQRIDVVPQEIKDRYKTAYEMSMRDVIQMSADRAPFVCQSQSLNLFVEQPSMAKLSSMHFFAWKSGLKTGQYYLRTKAATDAISGLGMDTSDCLMCSG